MRDVRLLLLPTLAALVAGGMPAPLARAQEGIHRCAMPGGDTIYTDRKCEDVGGIDRLPEAPPPSADGSSSLGRTGCSRTLSDLVRQIAAAVDAQDVNRLAGVYDWAGVSDAQASAIMNRLDAIAQRPLVDIVPVRPDPEPAADAGGNAAGQAAEGDGPQAPPRPAHPVGLRLEQTLKNSATPSSTVFGLRRSFNCFWISL
jgi:hypothetical protein